MRGMVYREFVSPAVRLTASQITAGIPGQDATEQAYAIREWVEQHTDFLRDPDGAEMLHGPVWQLQQVQQRGSVRVDCDDVAMLAAALGKSIGLRARFVVVGFNGAQGPYSHVWSELSPPRTNQWIEMDTTRPAQGLPLDRIGRVLTKDV